MTEINNKPFALRSSDAKARVQPAGGDEYQFFEIADEVSEVALDAYLSEVILNTPLIAVRVYGEPATQGSMRAFATKGKNGKWRGVITHNLSTENGKKVDKLHPWRSAIIKSLHGSVPSCSLEHPLCDFPVAVTVEIILPRLLNAPKNSQQMKYLYPTGKKDLDKHIRAIGDSLVLAGILSDDGMVCQWTASKRFAGVDEPAGAKIMVQRYELPDGR